MGLSKESLEELGESASAHEQEAEVLRYKLPDADQVGMYPNIEFIVDGGSFKEVDALIVTGVRPRLIEEVKGRGGGAQRKLSIQAATELMKVFFRALPQRTKRQHLTGTTVGDRGEIRLRERYLEAYLEAKRVNVELAGAAENETNWN